MEIQEKANKLEDRSTEIIQPKEEEKDLKKLIEPQVSSKISQVLLYMQSKYPKQKEGSRKPFEEIMAPNFPHLE